VSADWYARGIAIAGAATSASALFWQITSWKRSGPLIRVDAIFILERIDPTLKLVVTAYNSGRADAQLRTVHVKVARPGELGYPLTGYFPLPVTLPAGHSQRLVSERPIRLSLVDGFRGQGDPLQIDVGLGTGKTISCTPLLMGFGDPAQIRPSVESNEQ
jgi:hypothetical protein